MEYQVPQFIEIESKVVGTLTLRQFIYVAGGIGLCVVFFFYLPIILAFILSAPVAGLAVALSFYKVNGKPFIEMLEAAFNYYVRAKLFLWRHSPTVNNQLATDNKATDELRGTPKLTRGKLSELAWSLDVTSVSGLRTPDSGT